VIIFVALTKSEVGDWKLLNREISVNSVAWSEEKIEPASVVNFLSKN
jgi:hypothetical protein